MNASGRLNTCKSRGRVAISETGARVRNAYAIYLVQGNSPGKPGLMPHGATTIPVVAVKDSSVQDEHASH